jgi:hypothetical protein
MSMEERAADRGMRMRMMMMRAKVAIGLFFEGTVNLRNQKISETQSKVGRGMFPRLSTTNSFEKIQRVSDAK